MMNGLDTGTQQVIVYGECMIRCGKLCGLGEGGRGTGKHGNQNHIVGVEVSRWD